jgi:hypothetical protein
MTRKQHLQHTVHGGPTCQTGRSGAALRGEHITSKYSEFSAERSELQCERCRNSKLFAFLERQTIKALIEDWQPVDDPDAWKAADDAIIAKHRAAK